MFHSTIVFNKAKACIWQKPKEIGLKLTRSKEEGERSSDSKKLYLQYRQRIILFLFSFFSIPKSRSAYHVCWEVEGIALMHVQPKTSREVLEK